MAKSTRPEAPVWTHIILWCVLLLLWLPLAVMAWGAFVSDAGVGLDAFSTLLSDDAWMGALGRSLFVATSASLISMILGLGVALGLESRSRLEGPLLGGLLTLAMVMPELVFALSLLSWFAWVGFGLGLSTVIAAHVTFSVSFAYLVIQAKLQQLDPLLVEAAEDLGAGPWQSLYRIKLPQLKTACVSAFLICFLLSFDDFLISYFVNGVGSDTLPIKLFGSMKSGISRELNALATLLSVLSSILIGLILMLQLKSNEKNGSN